MKVMPLLLPDMVVVAAPELTGNGKITEPTVVAQMPWLQELGTNEVAEWMERRGVTPGKPVKITHMPGSLIMEAVRRGDGVTFTARCFVDREIKSGRLIELFSERDAGGYYIVTRPGTLRPKVRAFIGWLRQQAVA